MKSLKVQPKRVYKPSLKPAVFKQRRLIRRVSREIRGIRNISPNVLRVLVSQKHLGHEAMIKLVEKMSADQRKAISFVYEASAQKPKLQKLFPNFESAFQNIQALKLLGFIGKVGTSGLKPSEFLQSKKKMN